MTVTIRNFGEVVLNLNRYSSRGLKACLSRSVFKGKKKMLEYINSNVKKLEKCGFCEKQFSNYTFDAKIENNEIIFYNFNLKGDYMCDDPDCIEKRKHLNPNSFEHISKRKKISLEEADKWQKENNASPFYLHPGETKEEYSKRQSRGYDYFVRKYENGVERFKKFCDKLSLSNSKENFIERHSEAAWKELCSKKRQTLDRFIERYGEEEGKRRYLEFRAKTAFLGYTGENKRIQSRQAFNFFTELKNRLIDEKVIQFIDEIIFADGERGEKRILFTKDNRIKWYDLDCYFPKIGLVVEFFGENWHCDPRLNEVKKNPFGKIITSEKERSRIEFLRSINIDTIIVLSAETKNAINKKDVIDRLVFQIKERYASLERN